MKHIKRLICIGLILALLCGILPATALAATPNTPFRDVANNTWYTAGGMNAAEGEEVAGLEPPAEIKEFYTQLENVMKGSPAHAVAKVLPAMRELVNDYLWLMVPLQNVQQSVIANADLHNIPVGGIGIAGNFVGELFFYGE